MATKKRTQPDLYLLLNEDRNHIGGEMFVHWTFRVTTPRYEGTHGYMQPYGVDDDYGPGLLWSGLRVSCQGDEQSRRRTIEHGDRDQSSPVYAMECEYHDVHSVNRRKAERMHKTLAQLEARLLKIYERRGVERSYGEYVGRVAEALGCKGICFKHPIERGDYQSRERWDWLQLGDGVRRVNQLIEAWVDEARPATVEAEEVQ